MLALAPYRLCVKPANVKTAEKRLRIRHPVRLQFRQILNQINGDLIRRQICFQFQSRNIVLRFKMEVGVAIQRRTQIVYFFRQHGETRRHLMPPELHQRIFRRRQRVEKMKTRNAAARTLSDSVLYVDNDSRPII